MSIIMPFIFSENMSGEMLNYVTNFDFGSPLTNRIAAAWIFDAESAGC